MIDEGTQLSAIGIPGEYLERWFIENKKRPLDPVDEYLPPITQTANFNPTV